MSVVIRARKGKSRVTPAVSCLGYTGLSERGTFVAGGGLEPCVFGLLVAMPYSWRRVYLRRTSVETDA